MLTDLLKVERGTQGSFATTAAAGTSKAMGVYKFDIDPGVKTERIKNEMRASLAPSYSAYVSMIKATATEEGYVTAEEIPYLLDSLFGQATPTLTAGAYVSAYSGTLGTAASPRIQTLIFGDQAATYVEKLVGAICRKITFKAKRGGPLTYSAEYIGYNVVAGTFAGSSDRTTTLCSPDIATLSVDAFGGTIGSTSFATTAYEYEFSLENKRVVDHFIGSIAPGGHHEGQWETKLKLDVTLNATSASLMTDQLVAVASVAIQRRLVQLKFDNGGATSAARVVTLGGAFTAEQAPKLWTDHEGLVGFSWEAGGVYDPGAFAAYAKVSVTNNTSTLA